MKKLRIEISSVLLIKCIGLALLGWFCFSHPVDKTLNASAIQQHLTGSLS